MDKFFEKPMSYFLTAIVVSIIAVSLWVNITFASFYSGFESEFYYLKNILISLCVLLVSYVVFSFINPQVYKKTLVSIFVLVLFVGLVLATLFFGLEVNGNRQWLDLGIIIINPFNFIWFALILSLPGIINYDFRNKKRRSRKDLVLMTTNLLLFIIPLLIISFSFIRFIFIELPRIFRAYEYLVSSETYSIWSAQNTISILVGMGRYYELALMMIIFLLILGVGLYTFLRIKEKKFKLMIFIFLFVLIVNFSTIILSVLLDITDFALPFFSYGISYNLPFFIMLGVMNSFIIYNKNIKQN